jgi:uncharacterized tellurite resistance protein B-like protein
MAAFPDVRNLKQWIIEQLGGEDAGDDERPVEARNLAVAALLVEVLRADYEVSEIERRQVLDSLRGMLAIDPVAGEELLALAEARVDRAHDLHQFTSEINRRLSPEAKVDLVRELWRVAQADEVVHKYEEHIIRRIADLLHVSHRDFIAAKLGGGTR